MKWTKAGDRWVVPVKGFRYQVKWSGKRWMAYLNPFTANIMELQWRKVIGLFETSKDAKQACQEHYNATQERFEPEGCVSEHKERDEGGKASEAGSSDSSVVSRKVKKEEVLTAQG